MKKIPSLVFREFKINRKLHIIKFLLLFLTCAFVIGGTFISLNSFEEMPDKENTMEYFTQMISMVIILASTLIFSDDNTSFKSDLNSGWNNYSYALPVTAFQRSAAKLICFISPLGISALFGMVCVIIVNKCAGVQFQMGYVIFQFIITDILLFSTIIIDYFVLGAKNISEFKKMQDKGGLICLFSTACIFLGIMKGLGFEFPSPDDNSLSFGFLSELKGKMLLWLIPHTLVLLAVLFAVFYYHSQYAYSKGYVKDGSKTKKANAKGEETVNPAAPHSQPVGFLYKELKQNMKSIITVILLPFLILVFLTCCLTIVWLKNKYSGDNWIITTLTSNLFRLLAIALGFFCVSGLLLSVFHGDDKKLWAYFIVSVPDGLKKFLYTKYVLSFAMCGLYFVSSYIAETVTATISWFVLGKEIISFSDIMIVIFFVLIFYNSFSIPMMLRFGEKKGSIINLIIILCLLIATVLVLSYIPDKIQDKVLEWLTGFIKGEHGDLTTLLLGIFPAVSMGAYFLSYKVSCKIFMKGVKEYDK